MSSTFSTFFDCIFIFKAERRRRDLNPCAAINDLLPFQGSPFGQLGYFSIKNGEGGIRTHAPFRTNGFQDRLVMTTSIPLHTLTCFRPCVATKCILSSLIDNVNNFFHFFNNLKSQAINAKLYLRNIISSFCTTMFAFCWQICTDCPSFRFALCLFYSFYASLASSF